MSFSNSTLTPTTEDVALAQESSHLLGGLGLKFMESQALRLAIGDQVIRLPQHMAGLLRGALQSIAKGKAVALVPLEEEISPVEAAELLNVSRPFATRLFDEGAFPSRKVGTHRRALARDVLDYRDREKAKRLLALDELAAEGQRLGI